MKHPRRWYLEERSITIPCDHAYHQIIFRRSGCLSFPHHPKLAAEQALVAMGAPQPACLYVLEQWQGANGQSTSRLRQTPGLFRPVLQWIERRHELRRRHRRDQQLLGQAISLQMRLQAQASAQLPISWRNAYSTHPPGLLLYSREERISWEFKRSTWTINTTGFDPYYVLRIRPSWIVLHRLGIDVVDGYFILRLLKRDPKHRGGFLVQAIAPNAQTQQLQAVRALVTPDTHLLLPHKASWEVADA